MDSKLQKIIDDGKKNATTLELVKNWCAHVRLKKNGGIGLIEQQTGYPIGHHGLECDFAADGTGYYWDLALSALELYDQQCATCTNRRAVGFPNLTQLIAERDRQKEIRDAQVERAEREAIQQTQKRQLRRDGLYNRLPPVAASILDDITAFDNERIGQNLERLKESARLAPEYFIKDLVSYIFELTEEEDWFEEAGLSMLYAIGADPQRLVKLALAAVKRAALYKIASDILVTHISNVTSFDVPLIVWSAVEHASPERGTFGEKIPSNSNLLHAIWTHFPSDVLTNLESLLSSTTFYSVELAGRGFKALQSFDPAAANSSARSMISSYARACLFIKDFDAGHSRLFHLGEAISKVFENVPSEVDDIAQELLCGLETDSRARIFEIYSNFLRDRKIGTDDLISPDTQAPRIAFKRILWAPINESHDTIIKAAQDVFVHRRPYGLKLIARAEIEGLLGAFILLDDRLRVINEEPHELDEDFLAKIERNNRRNAIKSLMSNYVEWAAIAAGEDDALIKKVCAMIGSLPEDREELRGIALRAIEHLAVSVAGVNAMLPHLYSGLVGASTLVRASAATALGEISSQGHKNIPPLVYEAFSILLFDQYVIVHKSAVRALRRFNLPQEYRPRAAKALFDIFLYYSEKCSDEQFIVDCADVLASFLDTLECDLDIMKKIIIKNILKIDPIYLHNGLNFLSHWLDSCDDLADLVLHMLPYIITLNNHDNESWNLLQKLSDSSVVDRQERFVEFGISTLKVAPWVAYEIVERLSFAGATEGALKLAGACVTQIPDTELKRKLRTKGRSIEIAVEFEAAVKSDNESLVVDFSIQWEKNFTERTTQIAESNERNFRKNFPFAP